MAGRDDLARGRPNWETVTKYGAVAVLLFLSPSGINAQDKANVQALTVPTRNAGTCLAPVAQKTNGRVNPLTRSGLVIKTVTPGGSREITLVRDKAGTVVGYAEMTSVFVPPFASESDNIIASFRPDGRISGTWTHLTIRMSDSGVTKLDPASLRKMSERATRHSTQRPLDSADHRKIRRVVKWFSTRCPG